MDKPLRAKVSWDSHLFALRCMRRRLAAVAPSEVLQKQAEMAGEMKEDEEAHEDLPAELVETAEDSTLIVFGELIGYVNSERLSSNWSALLVRVLLLLSADYADSDLREGRTLKAREIFRNTFASDLMQKLSWCHPAPVPPAWLVDVVSNPDASKALLRVLSRYRQMEAEELSDIIEHVLLAEFLPWDHCQKTILASELLNDILGACMDAGKKANSGGQGTRCPAHWAGQHRLWRLEYLGRRLFHVAFVFQEGFLPHSWPDCFGDDPNDSNDSKPTGGKLLVRRMAVEDDICSAQPQVVEVDGSCLWDEGLLTIPLLRRTMMEGRAMLDKPILHYGRQVIMRHLWYKHSDYCEVPKLKVLWDLACWSLCEDAGLVRQALEYLKGTYRDLCRPGGPWSPENEEDLFEMFLAIDFSLLPIQVLYSPWVPAQVQSVRLFVQQQPADQFHQELQQEVSRAMEHLKSVNFQCSKLTDKLNAVDQRTVMNKSQISDSSAALEEILRKRRQKEGGWPLLPVSGCAHCADAKEREEERRRTKQFHTFAHIHCLIKRLLECCPSLFSFFMEVKLSWIVQWMPLACGSSSQSVFLSLKSYIECPYAQARWKNTQMLLCITSNRSYDRNHWNETSKHIKTILPFMTRQSRRHSFVKLHSEDGSSLRLNSLNTFLLANAASEMSEMFIRIIRYSLYSLRVCAMLCHRSALLHLGGSNSSAWHSLLSSHVDDNGAS